VIGEWLVEPVPPGRDGLRRLVPRRIGTAIARWHIRRLPRPAVDPDGHATPLELFLRIGPRDADVAPLALASLRRHLANPIARLIVATPRTAVADLRQAMPDAEVRADEDLIDADMAAAISAAAPSGREGWIRQQFLNLTFVSRHARGPCLVWDADTIMLRPQQLLRGSAARLAISVEHHQSYFTLIRALLPDLPLPCFTSTVAHHLVFDPELVRSLFREIEAGPGGAPWWRAIVSRIVQTDQSPFADYELYGQWIRTRHPARVDPVGFRNIAAVRRAYRPEQAERLVRRHDIDSVSLHWWYGADA
jgi:hypothetical protein